MIKLGLKYNALKIKGLKPEVLSGLDPSMPKISLWPKSQTRHHKEGFICQFSNVVVWPQVLSCLVSQCPTSSPVPWRKCWISIYSSTSSAVFRLQIHWSMVSPSKCLLPGQQGLTLELRFTFLRPKLSIKLLSLRGWSKFTYSQICLFHWLAKLSLMSSALRNPV